MLQGEVNGTRKAEKRLLNQREESYPKGCIDRKSICLIHDNFFAVGVEKNWRGKKEKQAQKRRRQVLPTKAHEILYHAEDVLDIQLGASWRLGKVVSTSTQPHKGSQDIRSSLSLHHPLRMAYATRERILAVRKLHDRRC